MIVPTVDPMTGQLTKTQTKAFELFRQQLSHRSPKCRIVAVEPLEDNMIRVWLDDTNLTYEMVRAACKLAVEIEDETGIFIFPR